MFFVSALLLVINTIVISGTVFIGAGYTRNVEELLAKVDEGAASRFSKGMYVCVCVLCGAYVCKCCD